MTEKAILADWNPVLVSHSYCYICRGDDSAPFYAVYYILFVGDIWKMNLYSCIGSRVNSNYQRIASQPRLKHLTADSLTCNSTTHCCVERADDNDDNDSVKNRMASAV